MSMLLRKAQTLFEAQRLGEELQSWNLRRRDTDCDASGGYRGQYETQRELITAEVAAALAAVREQASNLSAAGASAGEVYERLARIDRQIIWIRYAWDFYRLRFDQRDDPALAAVLKAADEVTWSCFKPAFRKAGVKRPPAPLPCIELDYAPSTLLSTHAHVLERPNDAEEGPLTDFFATLPVPLLRLPPTVVTCPWNLAIIAHEAGHAVYPHVTEGGGFPGALQAWIEAAVSRAGGDSEEQARWGTWAIEIFADSHAVLMMGSGAVWTIAQLEFGTEALMNARRSHYPSARVRLNLLVRFAERAGLINTGSALESLGLRERIESTSALDAAIAEEVSRLAVIQLPGQRESLAEAVAFRVSDFESGDAQRASPVEEWSRALLGIRPKSDETELRSARLVTAGAVRAACDLARKGEDDRSELAALCKAAVERIARCAEAGKRAAPAAPRPAAGGLARRLLDATDEQLSLGATAVGY
jgi:hypothetical protein